MPNTFDNTGLTVQSNSETVSALQTGLQGIYGADINLQSNSPDAQLVNIFAQSVTDMLELLVDTYASFSVTDAYGTVLDQRVALNGIARKQGTYTYVNLSLTSTLAVTLTGQDALLTNPNAQVFTVADNAGNQYQLVTTYTFSGAGTQTLQFRAVAIGLVSPTLNTITQFVTTVVGVSAVNNPTAPTSLGVNEETDAQLKIRHAQSFNLAAIGPADSLQAALLAVADITDAYIVENTTDSTVNGIPSHSVWIIVTGGTAAEIAGVIYAKKMLGCGMKGSQSYTVLRPNGNGFVAIWDTSIAQPLCIQFQMNARVAGTAFNNTFLKSQLVAALSYKLGQNPTIGDVIAAMQTIAPAGYLTNVGVSTDGVTYTQIVTPTDAQHYFTLSTGNITIS